MATSGGGMASSDRLRDSEYMAGHMAGHKAGHKVTPGAHIDHTLGGKLFAVGLGVATAVFAGRFAFQLWKPLGQIIMENAKKIPTSSLSYYYKGGFEQKMSKREASLILGISPSASKTKIRAAHRKIMILNHPDKGGSPYMAMKVNEAKDLLESSTKQ